MRLFGIQILWVTGLLFGIALILSGVLLILKPELLAFFFAGIFLSVGIWFVSSAISKKGNSYFCF